jgi:hypothetical protein
MTDIELAESLIEPDDSSQTWIERCIFTTVCIAFLLFLALIIWLLHYGFRT